MTTTTAAPALLVMEILSPSTRAVDSSSSGWSSSRDLRSYQLIDPLVPSLTVPELRGRRYAERAVVQGDERYAGRAAVPGGHVPAELLR